MSNLSAAPPPQPHSQPPVQTQAQAIANEARGFRLDFGILVTLIQLFVWMIITAFGFGIHYTELASLKDEVVKLKLAVAAHESLPNHPIAAVEMQSLRTSMLDINGQLKEILAEQSRQGKLLVAICQTAGGKEACRGP